MATMAEQILQFYDRLSQESPELPDGIKMVYPYKGEQKEKVRKVATAFYQKYYSDTHSRCLILGSSPARRGSAVTGVPFEDARHLQNETGIWIDKFYVNQASSNFLYEVMNAYGGCKKFYSDFYMNFVCPFALVKTNEKGNEVNCNYYENKKLQEALYPLILRALRSQIAFGIDISVCYCIGSGENYNFLTKLNKKHSFFDRIIPLKHPRFIMQYHSKEKDSFLKTYLHALDSYKKVRTCKKQRYML